MTKIALAVLAAACTTQTTLAQTPLTTVRVANGLARPVYVTHAPGDDSRVFIVEQRSGTTGRIRVLDLTTNTLLPTPFLLVSPVSTGSEQGLLGLAFHPDYLNNGYFWVNYTNSSGTTIVARYRAQGDPATSNVADASSATTVMSISQPYTNHNGGWIGFGPDGYLYISSGDGGSGGDPGNRAQNKDVLLGKMLRIDVDGADNIPGNDDDDGVIGMTLPPYTSPATNPFAGAIAGRDEVWAYGIRNAWRSSFDRETGDLWIADVGQNNWEEINFQPWSSTGGENYGWRCYEGNNPYNTTGCPPTGELTFPIAVYSHSTDGFSCSVTGGYVYRGSICDLRGTYFYADYCSNRIRSFRYSPGTGVTELTNRTTELDPPGTLAIGEIVSFGEDNQGELYICDLGGEVFKIVAAGPQPGDYNADGAIDILDLLDFLDDYSNCDGQSAPCGMGGDADVNGDTVVDILDFLEFLDLFSNAGCD